VLTTIARYFNPSEAQILCARLQADGIPASVADDQHMMANWALAGALGGARLQVPEAFAEEAAELVRAYHAGELERDLIAEHPSAAERCPACGGERLDKTVPLGQRALLLASCLAVSVPFPTQASNYRCLDCQTRWRFSDIEAAAGPQQPA